MAVSDVRTCPKCGQYQMPACMCALRAANAALKARMQHLSDSLACALDEIAGDDPAYKEKLIRRGRALLVPESERVPYGPALLHPQAAEPIVLDSLDAAEAAVSNVIRWLDSHKLIYGGLGDELETEKLIEDAKIGIGLIRYEVAAEPPERG
jgi:hypothetical protein